MTRSLIAALALCGFIGATSAAFAQTPAPTPSTPTSPTTSPEQPKAEQPKAEQGTKAPAKPTHKHHAKKKATTKEKATTKAN